MHKTHRRIGTNRLATGRSGKILVFFAILLTLLLGLCGFVIDSGRLNAAHREAQNAADAAAMAAALSIFRSQTTTQALTDANLLRSQNSPDSAALALNAGTSNALNIPPQNGPHAGLAGYAEAYVSVPVDTLFIHLLGVSRNRTVAARAVAGAEPASDGEGVIVLDPQAIPGLNVTGAVNTSGSIDPTLIRVDGGVIVNSMGSGYNQWGKWEDTWPPTASPNQKDTTKSPGQTDPGVSTQQTISTPAPSVEAKFVYLAGGTERPSMNAYKYYGDPNYPSGENPLIAAMRQLIEDPLRLMPPPSPTTTTARGGMDTTLRGTVSVSSGETVTLDPGIYYDITINSGTVTFNPGIYVLMPSPPGTTAGNQGAGRIRVTGTATLTGDGVMFYVTGDNYTNNGYGYWDTLDDTYQTNDYLDGPLPPTPEAWNPPKGNKTVVPGTDPASGNPSYGAVRINIGDGLLDLHGLPDVGDAYDDMLFFQRRRNANPLQIAANAGTGTVNLEGTVYAKWALLDISGGGDWTARFVVGSLKVSGGGVITLQGPGQGWSLVKKIFLVE